MLNIEQRVFEIIASVAGVKPALIDADKQLIGEGRLFDSMKLVELCLLLEDLATELGFNFDWTSDAAMSRSVSMFRTAGSLAAEFIAQMSGRS
ncbi:MAG: acyl carrier protein [Betaproteobacteria bacterium]|nr:acyl carrier protein [Betaproteobacteria bacterium]MBK9607626.1 acyl carrier protein [Betaproteobacteria bacterium]